jgi:hypothetical protein
MIAAVVVAFFAFAATGVISRAVFERLPHLEDEFAYLYQAKIFAGGHAWVVRNEPVKYFWQPFVIQPETSTDGVQKRFGKYTPGWPLLLTAGVMLGQPWIVNGFLAMLSVALVYRMGREIFKESVGLAAAILLAISPMALLLNATFMSHTSAMFMSLVFVYGYWRTTKNGRRRFAWAAASGLALGWIVATRPLTAVAIAAPVVLHAVSRLLDELSHKQVWPDFSRRAQVPAVILFVGILARVVLPRYQIIATLQDSPVLGVIVALALEGVLIYLYLLAARKDKLDYFTVVVAGLAFGGIFALSSSMQLSQVTSLLEPGANLPATVAFVLTALNILVLAYLLIRAMMLQPRFAKMAMPLVVLAVSVAPTTALWPLFNQIWTGDYRTNIYTMLWEYDQVGFGPGHGLMPGGHSLEYGWRNARADLTGWLRDLSGFTMDPGLAKYAEDNLGWGVGIGLSWILIVAGLIAGRKDEWIWLFFEIFIAIVISQLLYWIGSTVYGSAVYSVRYYYEATFAVCLVSGYGLVAWANALRGNKKADVVLSGHIPPITRAQLIDFLNGFHDGRMAPEAVRVPTFRDRLAIAWRKLWPGYIIFEVICLASLIGYTPARFKEPLPGWPGGLYHYNKVGQYQIDQINAMRAKVGKPNRPVLIVVLHSPNPAVEDNWRDYGAAMAMTSPYLDSDIVVVRVFDPEDAPALVQRFPDRLVLYQIGEKLYPSVAEAITGASVGDPAAKDATDTTVVQ